MLQSSESDQPEMKSYRAISCEKHKIEIISSQNEKLNLKDRCIRGSEANPELLPLLNFGQRKRSVPESNIATIQSNSPASQRVHIPYLGVY